MIDVSNLNKDVVFVPRKTLQFCVMSCIKKLLVGVEAIQLSLRSAPLSSSSSSSGAARRSSLSFLGPIREEKKVTENAQLFASSSAGAIYPSDASKVEAS